MWHSRSWAICIGCFNGRVLNALLVSTLVGSHGLVFGITGTCIEGLNVLDIPHCRVIMALSIVGWLWRDSGFEIVVKNGLQ